MDWRHHAFVALGSNQGDSPAILQQALDELVVLTDGAVFRSGLWASTPVDCPPGSPDFVNAVAAFPCQPGETPESLLARLQALERAHGRKPKLVLNEPRPLDLDLIVFGDQRRYAPQLTLPHPRAHQRRFVLQPLCEIAPELVLPGQCVPVGRLLASLHLGSAEVLRRLG